MIKDNVVNENTFPLTSTLINQEWLTTPEYVSQDRFETLASPAIIFHNPTDYPLEISGDFSSIKDYTIKSQRLDLLIPPQSNKQQVIIIESANESKIDLSSLPFIEVELRHPIPMTRLFTNFPCRENCFYNGSN